MQSSLLRLRRPRLRSCKLADRSCARTPRHRYTSSVTVTLGYDQQVRSSLPAGFGFLVPRSEGKRMLAATFVHNKFPHRAPEIVPCCAAFSAAPATNGYCSSDDEIVQIVRDELRQILGLAADPEFTRVYRWKAAMAQYGVGHLERLQRIEDRCSSSPAWRSPATASTESACRIASAPAVRQRPKCWRQSISNPPKPKTTAPIEPTLIHASFRP